MAPVWEAFRDGTAAIAVGVATATAFGPEIIKTIVGKDTTGRSWFIGLFLVGILMIAFGLWQRDKANRLQLIVIIASIADTRRDPANARLFSEDAARTFSGAGILQLPLDIDLPLDGKELSSDAIDKVDEAAARTSELIRAALRFAPDAGRIHLVPQMPLHAAFRFGAKLTYNQPRKLIVQQHDTDGSRFYSAVTLNRRDGDAAGGPFNVKAPQPLDNLATDPTAGIALAIDVGGRDTDFFDPVKTTCLADGFGWLVQIRNRNSTLTPDEESFTKAVDQIYRVWRKTARDEELKTARQGKRAIFLSGPVSLAIALGSRLATSNVNRWIPYTFNSGTQRYEPLTTSTNRNHEQIACPHTPSPPDSTQRSDQHICTTADSLQNPPPKPPETSP